MSFHWVTDDNAGMLTDFYELTMLQSYFEHGMNDTAVFDLFVRRLPTTRNYLVACGLEDVLHYLETFSFPPEHLSYLRGLKRFSNDFIDYLGGLHFTGDVYAVAEGTVFFANEPILEVIAPLPEAQIVETFVVNQLHLQSLAASKASRVVTAASWTTGYRLRSPPHPWYRRRTKSSARFLHRGRRCNIERTGGRDLRYSCLGNDGS